ncbi:MAG: OmpH family outer membrane protein [Planctomycetes bacterium]|nr:OmpH family outer membrane protein [Planctomycetota bacterium]
MKRAIFWASAVVLLAGVMTLSNNAWSQTGSAGGTGARTAAPAQANLPHKVGLIDMAHVFKNYTKFTMMREELKAEIQVSEEKAKAMQAELADMQNALKKVMEGSKEYSKIEQEIVKKAAEFEGFRRTASREFLKKESQIYLQVYTETSKAVEKYADHFKYTLIIRFNREELDTENPQTLLQGMNRQVVYHHDEDDITVPVLDFLNDRYAKSGAAPAAAPLKGATRPGTNLKN